MRVLVGAVRGDHGGVEGGTWAMQTRRSFEPFLATCLMGVACLSFGLGGGSGGMGRFTVLGWVLRAHVGEEMVRVVVGCCGSCLGCLGEGDEEVVGVLAKCCGYCLGCLGNRARGKSSLVLYLIMRARKGSGSSWGVVSDVRVVSGAPSVQKTTTRRRKR